MVRMLQTNYVGFFDGNSKRILIIGFLSFVTDIETCKSINCAQQIKNLKAKSLSTLHMHFVNCSGLVFSSWKRNNFCETWCVRIIMIRLDGETEYQGVLSISKFMLLMLVICDRFPSFSYAALAFSPSFNITKTIAQRRVYKYIVISSSSASL